MSKLRTIAIGFQFRAPLRRLPERLRRVRAEQARRHIAEYIRWVTDDRERAFIAGAYEAARIMKLGPREMQAMRDKVQVLARRPKDGR